MFEHVCVCLCVLLLAVPPSSSSQAEDTLEELKSLTRSLAPLKNLVSQQNVAELQDRTISELRINNSELSARNLVLESKLDEKSKTVNQQQEEVKTIRSELHRQSKESGILEGKNQQLQKQLVDTKSALEAKNLQLVESGNKLKDVEREKNESNVELSILKQKNQEFFEEVTKLQSNQRDLNIRLLNRTTKLHEEMLQRILNIKELQTVNLADIKKNTEKLYTDLLYLNLTLSDLYILDSRTNTFKEISMLEHNSSAKNQLSFQDVKKSTHELHQNVVQLEKNLMDLHLLTIMDVKNTSNQLFKDVEECKREKNRLQVVVDKQVDSYAKLLNNTLGSVLKEITASKVNIEARMGQITQDKLSKDYKIQNSQAEIYKMLEAIIKKLTIAELEMVQLGDQYYYFSKKNSMNWKEAERFCLWHDLTLVTIETAAEQQLIFEHKKDIGQRDSWLGGTDEPHEGRWLWTATKQPIKFKEWSTGRPERDARQNCIDMRSDGKWYDYGCGVAQSFICEMSKY